MSPHGSRHDVPSPLPSMTELRRCEKGGRYPKGLDPISPEMFAFNLQDSTLQKCLSCLGFFTRHSTHAAFGHNAPLLTWMARLISLVA